MQRKILLHSILHSTSPVHAEPQDRTAERTALVEAMSRNIRNGKDFACVSLFQAFRLPPRSRKIFRLASTMDSGFYAIIFSVQASPAACRDVGGTVFTDNRTVMSQRARPLCRGAQGQNCDRRHKLTNLKLARRRSWIRSSLPAMATSRGR